MKTSLFRAFIIVLLASIVPWPAFALTAYNPNNIISDAEFFDTHTMTLSDIQKFLEKKGSSLATYSTISKSDGQMHKASEIIYNAAITNGISPQVLLVLLQKEQSLIENPTPTQYNYDWATGFARCDSCTADDPRLAVYKGFANQVEKAAWRKRYYTTNPFEFTFRAGETRTVDGMSVTPINSATAALYNYTPHIHGNYSFWKLFARYFGKVLPDGMVVQVKGTDNIWLIQQGKKRLFASAGAFLSRYSTGQVVLVGQSDLDTYPDADPIKFPQYSLLKSPKGAIFLLVDDKKFGITSKAIFKAIGFNPDEVVKASDKELTDIPTGGFITSADANPMGELDQDSKTGGIFYVKGGIRYPILEKGVLSANFPYRKITRVKSVELDKLPKGDPVKYYDGSLVTIGGDNPIYVISNGEKRPIASKEIFDALGFKKENVYTGTLATLSLHPDGAPLDIGKEVPGTEPTVSPVMTAAALPKAVK